jgi:hypothetical protein
MILYYVYKYVYFLCVRIYIYISLLFVRIALVSSKGIK